MTTTIITRPRPVRTEPNSDDRFTRVLAAVNSHRVPRAPRPRCAKPAATLGAHLLAAVRAQDAAIPADRRVPRTLAEMQARLGTLTNEASCGSCGGAGGHTVDTSEGGVTRQSWVTCDACRGTGTV